MALNPEGSISETELAPLMVQLWREGFSGALRFENDSIIKIVYFKEGELLSASTNDRDDSFGEILLRGEKLSREHLKQAMSKRKDDESIADTLLALGFISRQELTWARRSQLVGVLRSVLLWEAGSYAIVSDYLPKRQEGTSFLFPQILLEVFLTEPERDRFDEAFQGGETVLERSPHFEKHYDALGLNEEADEICALVDGSRTVAEVAGESAADSFNVLKLLYALEVLGLLTRASAEAVEVPVIFATPASDSSEWSAVDLATEIPGPDVEGEAVDGSSNGQFMRAAPKSQVPRFLFIALTLLLLGIGFFVFRSSLAPGIPGIRPEPAESAAQPAGRPAVEVTPIREVEPSTPGEVQIQEIPALIPVASPTPAATASPTDATPELLVAATPPAQTATPPTSNVSRQGEAAAETDPVRTRYDQMASEFQNRMFEKPYSIQFAILCQTSSVTSALKLDASNVWFVPVRFRDQPCYRAFWGRYEDREAAETALSSLPASLRQGSAPSVVQTR